MNPYVLTRTMKIGFLCDGTPPQGLSLGMAGREIYCIFSH